MSLNSERHRVILEMPIETQMLPELAGMPYWARMTNELLLREHPKLLEQLQAQGRLKSYLREQQEALSQEARRLERQWRLDHPLSPEANHQERVSWQNHAKMAAREILIAELSKSLALLRVEGKTRMN
jgi:hypothetical protein